jgi:hypothetical protein
MREFLKVAAPVAANIGYTVLGHVAPLVVCLSRQTQTTDLRAGMATSQLPTIKRQEPLCGGGSEASESGEGEI